LSLILAAIRLRVCGAGFGHEGVWRWVRATSRIAIQRVPPTAREKDREREGERERGRETCESALG